MPNAIGSIANYLKQQGWKAGHPVAYLAKVSGKKYQQLQQKDKQSPFPSLSISQLPRYGIQIDEKQLGKNRLPDKSKVALIELTGKQKEHWLTCHNFYVITRYNQSTHYAMAVYQLSQALKLSLPSQPKVSQ